VNVNGSTTNPDWSNTVFINDKRGDSGSFGGRGTSFSSGASFIMSPAGGGFNR